MLERYQELDIVRSAAIICMIIYHTSYDLVFFYDWDFSIMSGNLTALARLSATLFLLLVGMSFSISASRKNNLAELWSKQIKRFVILSGCASIVSLSTYIADPVSYVRFGILHLIALSMLILPSVLRLKEWAAALGMALVAFGQYTWDTEVFQPIAMVVGFPPSLFISVDYFPLIPWFGVILIGFSLGHFLYVKSTTWRRHLPKNIPDEFTWLGRHSLFIYMIHQPIILGLLIFFQK